MSDKPLLKPAATVWPGLGIEIEIEIRIERPTHQGPLLSSPPVYRVLDSLSGHLSVNAVYADQNLVVSGA